MLNYTFLIKNYSDPDGRKVPNPLDPDPQTLIKSNLSLHVDFYFLKTEKNLI